jgi:hypothetical protein
MEQIPKKIRKGKPLIMDKAYEEVGFYRPLSLWAIVSTQLLGTFEGSFMAKWRNCKMWEVENNRKLARLPKKEGE